MFTNLRLVFLVLCIRCFLSTFGAGLSDEDGQIFTVDRTTVISDDVTTSEPISEGTSDIGLSDRYVQILPIDRTDEINEYTTTTELVLEGTSDTGLTNKYIQILPFKTIDSISDDLTTTEPILEDNFGTTFGPKYVQILTIDRNNSTDDVTTSEPFSEVYDGNLYVEENGILMTDRFDSTTDRSSTDEFTFKDNFVTTLSPSNYQDNLERMNSTDDHLPTTSQSILTDVSIIDLKNQDSYNLTTERTESVTNKTVPSKPTMTETPIQQLKVSTQNQVKNKNKRPIKHRPIKPAKPILKTGILNPVQNVKKQTSIKSDFKRPTSRPVQVVKKQNTSVKSVLKRPTSIPMQVVKKQNVSLKSVLKRPTSNPGQAVKKQTNKTNPVKSVLARPVQVVKNQNNSVKSTLKRPTSSSVHVVKKQSPTTKRRTSNPIQIVKKQSAPKPIVQNQIIKKIGLPPTKSIQDKYTLISGGHGHGGHGGHGLKKMRKKCKKGKEKDEKGFMEKMLPMMATPFLISSSMVPMMMISMIVMMKKSALMGIIGFIMMAINMFTSRKNPGAVSTHDLNMNYPGNRIAMDHYGWHGDEEYGAYINNHNRR